MLPEIGLFAAILALLLAAAQGFFGIAGAALGRERWMAATTSAVAGQFVMTVTAVGCLVACFISNDFSVVYVAENSNSALPLPYRIAALWGAHEGSLLLWIFLLSGWTIAVAIGGASLPRAFAARVLGVLGVVSFGLLLFTLATSNPFERLNTPPADGIDLNPLLQDPALAAHPPILYTGYVGLSVAFAFACAAMLEGRVDQFWARWTRPWTTAAWAFLTVGIALGSWWAYYTLGWGGYWFWDPVENASFMPWLVATALIHSLAVTDKRGLFKRWTVLLAMIGFSLSLLGTFLVRSGVLVSVHSFAADPRRGMFILALLVAVVGGALTLYVWRAPRLRSNAGFDLSARESFLLLNNVLLVVAAAAVFGGTLAPLVAETLKLGNFSVGAPYFRPTFLLPMLPLLALVGIGIHANWKRGALGAKTRRLLIIAAIALALALALVFGVYAGQHTLALVGTGLGFWIILSSLVDPIDRWRRRMTLSRSVLGMTLAHVGLGIVVIAITAVETYTSERDFAAAPGQSARVGDYDFGFMDARAIDGPNYGGVRGEVRVSRDGEPVATLYPEKRQYWVRRMVMTEAGIQNRHGSDLFVALGDELGAGRWSLRAQVRPLITFMWVGAFVMALGGAVAITDRRYRLKRETAPQTAGTSVAGDHAGEAAT
jgi:cytochrome c-type biogenesis protein CcmF